LRSFAELRDAGAAILRGAVGSAKDDPRREATLLLQTATGLEHGELIRRHDDTVAAEAAADYLRLVEERRSGVPLQILAGDTPFHEVRLRIESGVFIPRPETELLAERAREAVFGRVTDRPAEDPVVVLDLCTGTGAIAIAVAAAYRGWNRVCVHAGDWSPAAVRLARRNAEANSADVDVRRSDLFSAFADLEGRVDVLVSNPPYVEPGAVLPPEVRHDPPEALFDPDGGTGFHRRIARRGRDFLRPGGLLLLETGETQGQEVARILEDTGYGEGEVLRDLAGRDRFVRGVAPGGEDPSMRSS
jgi:release factor glutamine methyltransferase